MARIIRPDSITLPYVPRRRKRPATTKILRRLEREALETAAAIRDRARAQAHRIVAQARKQAAAINADAQAAGRAEAAMILAAANERALQLLQQQRHSLTALAVKIAEKIINQQLQLDPACICQLVDGTIEQAGAAQQLVLHVNPLDAQVVQAHLDQRYAQSEPRAIAVEPDENVAAGGCLIETEVGLLDGRIETQLAAILAALKDKE